MEDKFEFRPKRTLQELLSNTEEKLKPLIVRRIEELFALCPDMKAADLLYSVFKNTGDNTNPRNWTDGNYLKRLENLKRQLTEPDEMADDDFILDVLSNRKNGRT